MISFKNQEDYLPSGLILVSLLLLTLTVLYMILVPAPVPRITPSMEAKQRRQMMNEIKEANARATEENAAIAPRLWKGSTAAVSADVLGLLTMQTRQKSLVITAFRPQRLQDLQGLTEVPFTVQVSGSYAGIRSLLKVLDSAGSKVALSSAQIAASDIGAVEVTATVGISAYIAAAQPATASTTTTVEVTHA